MGKKKKKKNNKRRTKSTHTSKKSPTHPTTSTASAPETSSSEPQTEQVEKNTSAPSDVEFEHEWMSESTSEVSNDSTQTKGETWGQRLRRWGIQLSIFLVLYLGMTTWMNRSMLATGASAPAFTLQNLKGKQVSLKQYKGRRVILHFWATWCSACKLNMPMLQMTTRSYKNDPIFLSIVTDGHRLEAVRQIVQKKKLTYPILIGNQKLAQMYRVSRYPTTYFIDKRGRIVTQDSGVITPVGFVLRSTWAWLKGTFGF